MGDRRSVRGRRLPPGAPGAGRADRVYAEEGGHDDDDDDYDDDYDDDDYDDVDDDDDDDDERTSEPGRAAEWDSGRGPGTVPWPGGAAGSGGSDSSFSSLTHCRLCSKHKPG